MWFFPTKVMYNFQINYDMKNIMWNFTNLDLTDFIEGNCNAKIAFSRVLVFDQTCLTRLTKISN